MLPQQGPCMSQASKYRACATRPVTTRHLLTTFLFNKISAFRG
jgi:hypothetical protein